MEPDAVELEYQKLRDEVVSRIETRSQTITFVSWIIGGLSILFTFLTVLLLREYGSRVKAQAI